jgi:chloramphenicol-sensitive protein RarD
VTPPSEPPANEPAAATGALHAVIPPGGDPPAGDRPLSGREGAGVPAKEGSRLRAGVLLALGAYGIWGFLPLYFNALTGIPALEILGWRIVFSLVLCLILVTATRSWGRVAAAFRAPRVNLTLGLAGLIVSVNWLVYIIATTTGHVLEASLGYFFNPLVTIVLGVVVLRERLRPMQWVSVGLSFAAVVVLSVDYGALPWISLVLAVSFALYGLVKKNVGSRVDALTGLSFETAWLTIPAGIFLIVLGTGGGLALTGADTPTTLLLVASGIITAAPLLCFAGAASRLPLSAVGMFQYMTPILQFLIGYLVFGEHMSTGRWIGFAIVWLAVILLILDAARAARVNRRAARLARR